MLPASHNEQYLHTTPSQRTPYTYVITCVEILVVHVKASIPLGLTVAYTAGLVS